nr:DUF6503 family protein [uncultured Psychroserpens sp.]
MKYSLLAILSFFLLNCKEQPTEMLSAQTIIDKSFEVSGSQSVGASDITYVFRDRRYRAIRSGGVYSLVRMQNKDKDWIVDSLTNNGFTRRINYEVVDVPDSMVTRYSASVNSVHYFSVLPYGLNDRAVNKVALKDISIKDKNYHTIQVTFNPDGGGEDFEDVFLYWINSETFKVEYLAYSYNESDGKGVRFREAYNERYVKGIRFVDYNNYKPEKASVALTNLPQLFESGQLKLLSKIELEAIKVN